jgi:O-antigen ligase
VIAFAAAGLCAHASMIHMSRGAMIGVAVGGMMTVIVVQKTRRNVAYLACATLVGFTLAGPGVIAEFSSSFAGEDERDASAESRFALAADMWSEVQSNPMFGLGPRCWPLVADRYGWPPGKEGHNLWMQVASEFGIPGVSLLGSVYAIAVYRLFPVAVGRRYRDVPWIRPFAQVAVTAIPAFAVEQLVGSFYLMELPYYVSMLAAASLNLVSRSEQAVSREAIS